MEVSGASTSGSSQPPPEPMSDKSALEPHVGDLAAVSEGESASAVRERVVAGLKNLSKERDQLTKLRNDVKLLRRQREAMHSRKRTTMDAEIQLAKLHVENQAAVVAMLEGRNGPFKEKFLNERRFGRMVKVEVEEEEIPASEQLPPQCEANDPTPPVDSTGGLLQVIQFVESPVQVQHLLFSGEDIPDDMPDKVKTSKCRVSSKTVFVPFGDASETNALSICEDHPLHTGDETLQAEFDSQTDIFAEGLQIPAEPINPGYADSGVQVMSKAAALAPAECSSAAQQQEASSITPAKNISNKDTVGTNVANKSYAKAVSCPAAPAVNSGSVWGIGKGAPTFAQVVSSDPKTIMPGQQVQKGYARATTSGAPGPMLAPFSSAGGQRRNVVLLKWEDGAVSPARRRVVDLILAMGFGAGDLYALIHVDGTRDYTISFTRPEGLDLFWERYEAQCRSSPEWEGLVPVAVSVQSTVKKVTIILTNESVPAKDLEVWLKHYGELLSKPTKIMDDRNIWTGGWSVIMKLAKDGNVVRHLPSSAFIGRDRMTVFYPGQPKLCHRCGEKGHFSSGCSAIICTMCRGRGHVAKDCGQIRCNLCQCLGHPYSQCPNAWHNIEKEVREEFLRLEKVEAFFSGPSSPVADTPGPVQVPSPAPAATPPVSVSLPSVPVPVSPEPSLCTPPVSVPPVFQESVSPPVSSPPQSVPSRVLEDSPALQGEVCLVGVVEGTKGGATASSEGRAPGKARAKIKNNAVILSEDDVQYLEGRKGVRRKKRQKAQVVQMEQDPVPVSNRFSILSGSSAPESSSENGDSEMELEEASKKRGASGDEQQREAKKQSI